VQATVSVTTKFMSVVHSTLYRCLLLKILLDVPVGTVTLLAEPHPVAGKVVLAPVVAAMIAPLAAMGMAVQAVLAPLDLAMNAPRAANSTQIAALAGPLAIAMTVVPLVPTPIATIAGPAQLLATAMTAVPPAPTAEMTAVHHALTAEMTVAPLVPTPIVVIAVLAQLLAIAMTAVPPVRTAETTVVRHVTVAPAHPVVNLMIAAAGLVVPVRRARVRHVASTTMRPVIVGAKTVLSGRVRLAMNHVRVFSVTTPGPVLIAKIPVRALIVTTAHVAVALRTAIDEIVRLLQKSKNVLMPSVLPNLVVGVA